MPRSSFSFANISQILEDPQFRKIEAERSPSSTRPPFTRHSMYHETAVGWVPSVGSRWLKTILPNACISSTDLKTDDDIVAGDNSNRNSFSSIHTFGRTSSKVASSPASATSATNLSTAVSMSSIHKRAHNTMSNSSQSSLGGMAEYGYQDAVPHGKYNCTKNKAMEAVKDGYPGRRTSLLSGTMHIQHSLRSPSEGAPHPFTSEPLITTTCQPPAAEGHTHWQGQQRQEKQTGETGPEASCRSQGVHRKSTATAAAEAPFDWKPKNTFSIAEMETASSSMAPAFMLLQQQTCHHPDQHDPALIDSEVQALRSQIRQATIVLTHVVQTMSVPSPTALLEVLQQHLQEPADQKNEGATITTTKDCSCAILQAHRSGQFGTGREMAFLAACYCQDPWEFQDRVLHQIESMQRDIQILKQEMLERERRTTMRMRCEMLEWERARDKEWIELNERMRDSFLVVEEHEFEDEIQEKNMSRQRRGRSAEALEDDSEMSSRDMVDLEAVGERGHRGRTITTKTKGKGKTQDMYDI